MPVLQHLGRSVVHTHSKALRRWRSRNEHPPNKKSPALPRKRAEATDLPRLPMGESDPRRAMERAGDEPTTARMCEPAQDRGAPLPTSLSPEWAYVFFQNLLHAVTATHTKRMNVTILYGPRKRFRPFLGHRQPTTQTLTIEASNNDDTPRTGDSDNVGSVKTPP